MLLQLNSDLNSIYPQSKWDQISTLIPLFLQTERTQLRKYLGSSLLSRLNADYTTYSDSGVQSALISSSQSTSATLTLDILSSCQRYIAYLTFSNNIRIFSSSFNRGGGVNRAYSDSYDPLTENDYAALSRELFLQSQDALEDLLLLLEQDASDAQLYTDLWKENTRYFYHHSSLLFPTALSLNPYYDIQERREKYQSLVPQIESCQRRYLLPNMGKSLYEAFLTLTNSLYSSQSTGSPLSSDVQKVLTSALPDLLHSLAYYLRADTLALTRSTIQEQQQYLLRAEQHRNLSMRLVCQEPALMQTYILGTPLDKVYADLNSGLTLTDQLAQEAAEAKGEKAPSTQKHSHTLPSTSFLLDLT